MDSNTNTSPITGPLSIVFTAGSLGGLFNSLAVWLFGWSGITLTLGVHIQPVLTPEWLYPRLVWGGIWGLLFLIPMFEERVLLKLWLKGAILSLGPTLVQLLVVFPFKVQAGWFGLELGGLTPAFVVFFNLIWGWTTAHWVYGTIE